ncbi:dihydrolipoyl dehydrogenase [Anoxybacter fermentans]|uniref:Dihydrolipoyl dehydrogenase n=1 Tax=Anoxybacter fermentans TaxID=1323375 RepID=A0A3S9SXB5_9FIRM|nr:dihydrolipoyl dehydrogenase [Anoxybacter fermentans]AZR72900.1 dihydrolipoyl dehydrogenase [Anoxybacter fermentans]
MSYDLIVIGAGPGGYVAAIRAAQLGGKVAIVEKDAPGGTCLNRGCIPTKALTASCDVLRKIKDGKRFGINVENYSVDFEKIMAHKERTVKQLVKGIEFLFKKNKIDVYKGMARIIDPNTVQVSGEEGTQKISGKNLIIATGSIPQTFPNMNYDGERIITSEEILNLKEVPESLLVVGGGVIGCEFASIFTELGSKVTVVDIMPRLIPNEDKEISAELERQFKRARIKVQTGVKIETIERTDDGIVAKLENGTVIEAQMALLSLGRLPYTEGLGLDELGVTLNRGAVVVNEYLETNIPNIYAVGDVTGKVMLAHVASAQGIRAVENIFKEKKPMNYDVIPSCIFTHPEIGTVGLTEAKAKEKGLNPKIGKFFFKANGKALTINEPNGFVKIVADENDIIVGAQIIGPHASDLIHELALAVQNKLTVSAITLTIHAHPTLAETVLEAVEDIYRKAVHK